MIKNFKVREFFREKKPQKSSNDYTQAIIRNI